MSVLVANYNYARFVPAALESVLKQTYQHFEVVVCDDGSQDDSCRVIEGFARRDPRIRLIRKDNGGAASALNRAFEHAVGDVVCLLDADDEFEPTKLERVVRAMVEQRCGLLVHALLVVDERGDAIQRKPAFGRFDRGWIAPDVIRSGGRWNYMEASAVTLHRDAAELVFPIPEDLFRTWADAYLCCLGALVTTVGYLDEPLARYRLHGGNVSGFKAFTEGHGNAAMNGYVRLVEGVNRTLADSGVARVRLDVGDNLSYLESRVQAELLGPQGSLFTAAPAYVAYARRVVPDRIYSRARKLLTLFFLGSAMLLPRRLRAGWITVGLTHSRAKEAFRKILRGGGRSPTASAEA